MISKVIEANTMVPRGRIDSLHKCMRRVVDSRVEGDLVECGTWRGGLAALMLYYIKQNGLRKKLYIYDTFQGMPRPSMKDDPRALEIYLEKRDGEFSDWCRADKKAVMYTLSQVSDDFSDYCVLIPGMVEHTLQFQCPQSIALCRVDTDWYESTKIEFEVLYPRILPGGYMIVDDYSDWKGCKTAVDEFMGGESMSDYVKEVDCGSLIIRKLS